MITPFDAAPMVPQSLILAVPPKRVALLEPLVDHLTQPDAQRQVFGRGLAPGLPRAIPHDGRPWTAAMTPELAISLEGCAMAPPLNPYAKAFMIGAWDARIGARHREEQ